MCQERGIKVSQSRGLSRYLGRPYFFGNQVKPFSNLTLEFSPKCQLAKQKHAVANENAYNLLDQTISGRDYEEDFYQRRENACNSSYSSKQRGVFTSAESIRGGGRVVPLFLIYSGKTYLHTGQFESSLAISETYISMMFCQ